MSNLKVSSIYAIRCKHTGKVYIGRSQNPVARMRQHFMNLQSGGGRACGSDDFREDYIKYKADGFELYILEEGVMPCRFREREAFWINEYKATDPRFGYNKDSMDSDVVISVHMGLPPKPIDNVSD